MLRHIKDIYLELPFHVDKPDNSLVENAIERLFNWKETKNSPGHHKNLLVFCSLFDEKFTNTYLAEILITLSEMQRMLNFPEKERDIVKDLQRYSIIFQHAMPLKHFLPIDWKNLQSRIFSGSTTVH